MTLCTLMSQDVTLDKSGNVLPIITSSLRENLQPIMKNVPQYQMLNKDNWTYKYDLPMENTDDTYDVLMVIYALQDQGYLKYIII